MNNNPHAYALRIDGPLLANQRRLLLKVMDMVFRGDPYVAESPHDEDLLQGVMALMDEIADQAHDQHGIDSLIPPEPDHEEGLSDEEFVKRRYPDAEIRSLPGEAVFYVYPTCGEGDVIGHASFGDLAWKDARLRIETCGEEAVLESGPHNQYRCECDLPGYFYSGAPGIIAHMENGRLAKGAKVERCQICCRYPSDAAALEKLKELGLVPS